MSININNLPHHQLAFSGELSPETQAELGEVGYPTPQDPWGDPVLWYIKTGRRENQSLRQGNPLSEKGRWYVLGMKCRPQYQGFTYRGMLSDPGWEEGQIIKEAGFTASSKSLKKATIPFYFKGVVVVIKGRSGYDLTQKPIKPPIGPYKPKRPQCGSGEGEVVFLPGTSFKVLAKGEITLPDGRSALRYLVEEV